MAKEHLFLLLAPVIGLGIDCVVHVAVSRYGKQVGSVRAIIVGVLAGLVATLLASGIALSSLKMPSADSTALALLNVGTYFGLAYGYIGYVGLNLTSLRIHVLKLLWEQGGSLSRQDLLSRYNNTGVAAERIDALIRGGYLTQRDGRLFTGKRTVVMIAALWEVMRRMVLGRNRPAFPSRSALPDCPPATRPECE